MKFTRDILQNCTFETYIILLTTLIPINLIKLKQKFNKSQVSWEEYKQNNSFEENKTKKEKQN